MIRACGRVLVRAPAHLVGIGRRRVDWLPLAVLCVAVGLWAGCAVGWRLCRCCVWLSACCAVSLASAVACIAGLLAGSCAPALCLCWWRLSACALSGGYGGVYIKLPGDYTVRVKPLGAAILQALAAVLHPVPPLVAVFRRCPLRRCWRRPPAVPAGDRPPVPPWRRCRWWRCLLLWAVLLPVPEEAARRHGPPHGKRRRKRAGFSRPVCRTSPAAGPGPGRAPAPRHPPGRSRQAAELEKIPSENSGGVFYAPGLSLASWYINAPL